ncbi:Pumilio-like protein 3 [Plecturocebus cupreus]
MHCLWHSMPKDRKVTVKTVKTYIEKVTDGQYSHLVLLAAFDCIDDIKLVKQIIIITGISSSLPSREHYKHGRKVLLYLLNPRDPVHPISLHVLISDILGSATGDVQLAMNAIATWQQQNCNLMARTESLTLQNILQDI